jgi:hypothetical protein
MEGIILDWLGKMMGLPDTFLQSNENGNGGGCIQVSILILLIIILIIALY